MKIDSKPKEIRYTPEQNGVATRTNGTLGEKTNVCCNKSVNTVVYFKGVRESTPEEKRSSEPSRLIKNF